RSKARLSSASFRLSKGIGSKILERLRTSSRNPVRPARYHDGGGGSSAIDSNGSWYSGCSASQERTAREARKTREEHKSTTRTIANQSAVRDRSSTSRRESGRPGGGSARRSDAVGATDRVRGSSATMGGGSRCSITSNPPRPHELAWGGFTPEMSD